MALSGRQLSDISSSSSDVSAEDAEHSCEPCLATGQNVNAHEFCADVQKYLCISCFESHKGTKASQISQPLDGESIEKQAVTSEDSVKCTGKNSHHIKETVNHVCPVDDCDKCMPVDGVTKVIRKVNRIKNQYSFQQDADSAKLSQKPDTFGMDVNLATPVKKTLGNFTREKDICVKMKSDIGICFITGCAGIARHKLVLADYKNKKLKVVDTERKTVIEEKKLVSKPFDIAAMPRDQFAVTMPVMREILVMTTDGKLSVVKNIPVKGKCMGITYHQDKLFVVCTLPDSVHVVDAQGAVQNTISLNNVIFNRPHYIVLNEDSTLIYISDLGSDCVVGITFQGEVSAVYKHEDLIKPTRMLLLEDGSLLVCCWESTIHHISRDWKQGDIMIALWNQRSICYSYSHDEVYTACVDDQLKVLNMK